MAVLVGGVVQLSASRLLLDGDVRVDGGAGQGPRGGGGAAGSVHIDVSHHNVCIELT